MNLMKPIRLDNLSKKLATLVASGVEVKTVQTKVEARKRITVLKKSNVQMEKEKTQLNHDINTLRKSLDYITKKKDIFASRKTNFDRAQNSVDHSDLPVSVIKYFSKMQNDMFGKKYKDALNNFIEAENDVNNNISKLNSEIDAKSNKIKKNKFEITELESKINSGELK